MIIHAFLPFRKPPLAHLPDKVPAGNMHICQHTGHYKAFLKE